MMDDTLFGGSTPGGVYGASPLPAEFAWNPARYEAEVSHAHASSRVQQSGTAGALVPMVLIVVVLWILAERHASIRAGGSGSLKL